MAASVKLPEISPQEHHLLMDALETRMNYLADELKLGDLSFSESRRTREEIAQLRVLKDKLQ